MADEPLAQQLATLRSLLNEVDTRLARAPVAPPGLEDLKRSVDTLRTNMWAIMSAGHGAMATTFHPEHTELQLLARQLAEQIGKLR
jgi:hypothetical protein